MNTNHVMHMIDNSARFNQAWPGWRGDWLDKHLGVLKQYGVGIFARQPIPTASRMPLHADGVQQNTHRPEWTEGFVDVFNAIYEQTCVAPVFYVGHPSHDRPGWPATKPNRPYAPSPSLDLVGGTAYREAFAAAVAPYLQAGCARGGLVFDGSSFIPRDTPAFEVMDTLRAVLQAQGRVCGVESPPDLKQNPHFKPFSVAMTYANYANRRAARALSDYTGPRYVLAVDDNLGGIEMRGDLGGWSREMHDLVAGRVVDIIDHGCVAVLSLLPVMRANYSNLYAWLYHHAARRRPARHCSTPK